MSMTEGEWLTSEDAVVRGAFSASVQGVAALFGNEGQIAGAALAPLAEAVGSHLGQRGLGIYRVVMADSGRAAEEIPDALLARDAELVAAKAMIMGAQSTLDRAEQIFGNALANILTLGQLTPAHIALLKVLEKARLGEFPAEQEHGWNAEEILAQCPAVGMATGAVLWNLGGLGLAFTSEGMGFGLTRGDTARWRITDFGREVLFRCVTRIVG
jgi:hypothetical protein